MSKKHYAVEVHSVKKSFYLPHHKSDSLKRAITQVFKPREKGGTAFNALNDISFNVEKGDFFGILGRNGSGKSTLLKIISEIYQPTSGTVKHQGKLVSFIELGVGFKPELSGRENVFLNGALLGFSRQEVEAMYDDIVAFAELEAFMDQKLKNYSSGMKVRLAFSVAIRAKADILVLDEVLAVGDVAFQKKCNDYFRTLIDSHKTVILVTHSMKAVQEYCNKAILIENGVITHSGAAADVANEYLKLFNSNGSQSDTSNRFGTGKVKIETISSKNKGKQVEVIIDIRADATETKDIVLGVDVYDRQYRLVGGVESYNTQGGHKFGLKPHQQKRLRFIFDNVFGTGDYYLTISIKKEGGMDIYDFWNRASSFSNVNASDYNSYFPVVLPAVFSIDD